MNRQDPGALLQLWRTLLSSGQSQAKGDDNKSNNDQGEEEEEWSDHKTEAMFELVDGFVRALGRESDSDVQTKRIELRADVQSSRADALESKFKRTGAIECSEKAIELRSEALSLTPEGDAKRAYRLSSLGASFYFRFKRLGQPVDVDKAIEYLTQAMQLTHDGSPKKPELLSKLGVSYGCRFEYFSELEDVGKAIECHTQAMLLTSDGDANKPIYLNNLGSSYLRRYRRLGELADADKAIDYLTQAVLLTPDGDLGKPGSLGNLANSYSSRFHYLGHLADIEKAIEYETQAVLLASDGHEDKPGLLNDLGCLHSSRFERLNELADLNKAIEATTQAVLLTPHGHPEQPDCLGNLGTSYARRFESLGELADLDKAIECHNQAVRLTPDRHANKQTWLSTLGTSYLGRFERFGELADVNEAIELQTRALQLTPDGHAGKPHRLGQLGNSYARRFERLGELENLDTAIECHTQALLLTPDGHGDKPGRLSNLGASYSIRYQRLGEAADINKSIECNTEAVMLTPDGNTNKSQRLSNVGNSYFDRFRCYGEIADIDKAIKYYSQAVLLVHDGHPDKPIILSNFGNIYSSRFERLGELPDLVMAIKCQTQAVVLTPDDHGAKSCFLDSLGISYLRRFERLGEVADINKAIEVKTQAVLLTPDGHAAKLSRLTNLGNSYASRFKRLGELADLEKAIEYQTQGVLFAPEGHADKPRRLNNLGGSYLSRFDRLGELTDLNKAIEYHTQAVMLVPDGHAKKPSFLKHLGVAHVRRYTPSDIEAFDLESSYSAFQRAAQHIVTDPETQIWCARRWVQASTCLALAPPSLSLSQPYIDISPLPAYKRCMELIPHVIWLGRTVTQRYHLLSTISHLATEAAAWAISVQELDLAIEWLEQGRSIVWNQILQLRTPFDELSAAHPALAERLKSIASQLEGAGTRSTKIPSSNGMQADPEMEAQGHRRLAGEWETVLAEARKIPGFENFMRPRTAMELKRSATDGPIVLINTDSTLFHRSDALIIFPQRENLVHVPLPHLSPDKVAEFREQLYYSARYRGESDRGFNRVTQGNEPDDPFKSLLADLWSTIVKPILDALECMPGISVDQRPHVTWCATGALAFLPLHAAGPYDGTSPNAFDLVVSSYTPTLSALLASNVPVAGTPFGILAVGQKDTPRLPRLPYTVPELAAIKKHAEAHTYLQLDEKEATVNAVLDAMDEHSWVHLACHASQNPDNPVHSAFHLNDSSLTLEAITKRQFKNKGLAFLSACQTATGDSKMPDEAVHLAAGMLMAGYPSVIGTMWPIRDVDGPEVADRVYAELLKDGKMDHRGAARALHKGVAELREKIGKSSSKSERWAWVPFVHIGV